MSKVIAVTGATGTQGGGVLKVMSLTPGWKVRAITRNPGSEAAQKLADDGIQVVQADFNDEGSLVQAFQGVNAVYAVTNWWEALFSGKSQDEAGEVEERHGINIARAAAKTETLEHYIWSTEPSAKKQFAGQHVVPHMDYKAIVDERIKTELPELAAKTTYLYLGYYPQNMAYFPFLRPVEFGSSGQYVQMLPTKPDAKVLLAGDLSVNPGIWVRQVLTAGPKAYGRYANVALEKWAFQEMLDEWSQITGKRGVFVECTAEAYERLWGAAGAELALQLRYGELCDPWAEREDFISPQELGINADEVVGFTGAIEKLKQLF